MRRALLLCAAIAFAIACGDSITEPIPNRTLATPTVAFATTTTEDGLSISTDKDDYQPGDTVHFTGSGWQAGDVLDIVLTDDPLTHEPLTWSVNVGADGMFHDSTYVVDEGDLDVKFTLVATSRATGRSLTVQFTDGVTKITGSPLGLTFNVPWVIHTNSTCTNARTTNNSSGTATLTPNKTTDNAGNAGTSEFQKLTAPPTTSEGGTFKHWIRPDNTTTTTNPLCVPGVGGSGTPTYTAVYTAADLTVDKAHSGNFTLGSNGTYTFTVGNSGDAATSGTITLTDPLPTGLTFVGFTGTGWACAAAGTTPITVTCTRTAAIAAGGAAPVLNLTVGVGSGTAATITNTVTVAGGGEPGGNNGNNSDSDQTTTEAAGPTKLVFTTDAFSQTVNLCSPQITIQTQNASNAPTNPTANTTVSLTSSSAAGTFYSNNTCTTGITSVSILTTGNTASFFYKDGTVGTPTLTAAATGLTSATQQETITAVPNVAPVVDAGGPYTGAEGSAIALNQATATDADGDALIYKWTYVAVGSVDVGTSCSFSNDAILQPTFTCNDDGTFTVTLTVNDGHGHVVPDDGTVTVANVKPVATAGGPYSGDEGSAIQLSGSGDDPGNNDDDPKLTYLWTVDFTGIDAGGTCTFDDATKKNAKVTCTDNSNAQPFTLTLVATDDDGLSSIGSTATLTVANVKPVAEAGGGETGYLGDEGSPVQLDGSATDVGSNDKIFTWAWVSTAGADVDAGAMCTFSDIHAEDPTITCTDNGTFTLTLTVKDDNTGESSDQATLTLANVKPVANAGGPYSGNEGAAIQLNGSADDPGNNDDPYLTFLWTVNTAGIDADGSCKFYDPAHPATPGAATSTVEDPTIKCDDDSEGTPSGHFTVSLVVSDDDGASSAASEAILTVVNVAPTVVVSPASKTIDEGGTASFTATVTDPGANDKPADFTFAWSTTVGACSVTASTIASATFSCNDNGSGNVKLTVNDGDSNGEGFGQAALTVNNVNPIVTIVTPADYSVWNINNFVGVLNFVNASFTDLGTADTHTCTIDWGNGVVVDGTITETSGSGNCKLTPSTNPYTGSGAGIYTLTVKVTDDDGGEGSATRTLIVYDPAAGFVTGGGWINSPAGACYIATCTSTTTGRANFGFVSKYLKATSTVPSGKTEFQFQAGNLNFHSESYNWLLVNQDGTNAQYKGAGTINGVSGYKFMLWATDGAPTGGYDTFRIKIWSESASGEVVAYDNMGTGGGYSTVPIAGGSIVIHTNRLATK